MTALTGKKIILGVTGGIAAYKSPDVVRRLREAGADVRVVLTEAGSRMVSPIVFQAVSGHRARTSMWDEEAEAAMGHIELARWADVVLVAPATAHIMSILQAGSAGNLLTTLCLATDAPVVLAPAMNQAMWRNRATMDNRAALAERGIAFVGPTSGSQACGDEGPGRMAEPADIVDALDALFRPETVLAGRRVLVTAGPTREPIDPVRFVSNRSSGKMGFAIAAAAAAAGARVTLLAGPVGLPTPDGCERIDVETAGQMSDAAMSRAGEVDIFIAAAAVADYQAARIAGHKIKKKASDLVLELTPAPDVLAGVAALGDAPFTVGFAAETQNLEAYARAKLERKGLDMIIANLVGESAGFDKDDNSAIVIWTDGKEALDMQPKTELAVQLIRIIAQRFDAARANESGHE
jgi:phosphopantothenoylcysteine decarboxylase/phosphopantothenate--cysteine ligase